MPRKLPMAAPMSRFRLTVRSFHSNRMMAAPSNTPTPASTLRVNPKGSMTKQVTATTMRKRRRTRMISTVNLPADASCLYAHTTRRCTRASSSPRDGTGRSLRMRGAHELGDECAPRPGLVGLSRAISKPTPKVYTRRYEWGRKLPCDGGDVLDLSVWPAFVHV